MNPQKILQKKYGWIVLLIMLALLILLSAQLHTRIDLTKEKRYSLSTSTKQLLNQLEGDVEIKVLLSGKLSASFRKLKNSTSELLENFRSYSNGHLHFTFIQPGEGLSDSLKIQLYDSLVHMGIKPFNNLLQESDDSQTERIIFPAAIVEYNGKLIPVDLMSGKSGMDEESTLNYSEALLEFKFDDAIQKLTTKQFPVIAYAVGNGEPLNPTVNDLFTTLSNNYRFGIFDLKNGILNADTIKALMIVKPQTAFTEDEKIKIDQYIMQGGNVLWFIDRLYAEFDSLLRAKSDFVAFDKGLNIDDQLFKYGVRINPDLLQDLNSAKQPLVVGNMGGQPQIQRIPFPYYPLLTAPENHPISRNLDQVLSIFPSSIDTVEAKGIKKTVLLATDTSSRKLGTPAIVSLRSIRTEGDLQTFTDSKVPVVVLLEGKFKSLYANRFDRAMQDSVEKLTGIPFMSQGDKVARQIVASDADIVTNVVTQSNGPLPMGTQQFENYQFANKEFLLNCLDYLVGNRGIIETRNKEFTLRLLDKTKVKDNKTFWQFINIVVPIVIILLLGIILQWNRKKMYTNI
jgi:gliding-associated putative ABC transporter substrate-binding component GldG